MQIPARVAARVRRWRRGGLDPAWVVAVSGGSDSVGLLRVLAEMAPALGLRLSVAYLYHGIRPESAGVDRAFVADLAGSLGLPFDAGSWHPTRPGHFEADARAARYAWLAGVADGRGASAVAVGHTRDDQAETILHRILRGTGPGGLAGMAWSRPIAPGSPTRLVRPLLDIARDEIQAHLAAIGQPFRDDPTNLDTARTRARLRHDLLPKLAADYNPRVVEALARLGRLAAAAERASRRQLSAPARRATLSIAHDAIRFDRLALIALPAPRRAEVIRRAWRLAGWPERSMDSRRWLRLAALARPMCGRHSIGVGIEARPGPDVLILIRPAPIATPDLPAAVPLPIPGSANWGPTRVDATIGPGPPGGEILDLDRIAPPLTLGPATPSERFEPLGMGGRGMPLGDFLRTRRVPLADRPAVPVVRDQQGIIWVVGHRIADRVRRTDRAGTWLGLRRDPG